MDPTPPPLPLGTVLPQLRQQQNLTQEALAHAAGVSVTTIASIEQGRRPNLSVRKFCAICAALQTPPALLIDSACFTFRRAA